MRENDFRGRLVAIESLLLVVIRSLSKVAPVETDDFVRGICAKTRAAIGRRSNIVAFPGLRHRVSDDALEYLVKVLESESELPARGPLQGNDAA